MFVANKFGSLLDVYPKRAKFLSDILLLVGVAVCTTTHMIDLTMETHSIGLDWIGLDWIGLDWIGLDWIGLDWIGIVRGI